MFCGKCGTQVEDGAAFCPNCGSRFEMEKQPDNTSQNASVAHPAGNSYQTTAANNSVIPDSIDRRGKSKTAQFSQNVISNSKQFGKKKMINLVAILFFIFALSTPFVSYNSGKMVKAMKEAGYEKEDIKEFKKELKKQKKDFKKEAKTSKLFKEAFEDDMPTTFFVVVSYIVLIVAIVLAIIEKHKISSIIALLTLAIPISLIVELIDMNAFEGQYLKLSTGFLEYVIGVILFGVTIYLDIMEKKQSV